MKKILITAFILCLIWSCKTRKSTQSKNEEDFVHAYKVSYLYGCINDATNGNFRKFSKDNDDLGLAIEIEVLQNSETEEAIALGSKKSKEIQAIGYEDFAGKKPIFSRCALYAFSRETDSIARLKYREKMKN